MSKRVSDADIALAKRMELEALENKLSLIEGLPHLHGWKWYKWARAIFESANREILCTAANQISKSSTAVRKNIELAGNPETWKKFWPLMPPGQKPNQFWYFYPTFEVATIEFETKWVPLFLPKGKFKNHPTYGWHEEYNKNYISSIRFNSGVTIYFKSYEQKVANLQTGSVYMVTMDEEAPEHLLPEVFARLNATDGLFLSVFTATLGQLYWEQAMEPKSPDEEKHKDALKLQVSVYDCMFYEDGTPSHWTEDKIKRAEARCTSEAERLRRIMGRFVKSEGLRFHGFDRGRDVVKAHPLPRHWHIYTGVDPGSGGITGHPAGMLFLAVSPDFKNGRVFRAWRGDGVPTTSQDTLNKYRELRKDLKPVIQVYDWASKDFWLVASRQGETFTQANKDRESGFGLLNVLFKNGMLKIQGDDPELEKLISELCSIPEGAKKSDHFVDDLCDALRYAAEAVPWDFSSVKQEVEAKVLSEEPPEPEPSATDLRRDWFMGPREEADEISDELDYWNDMAGT